MKALVLLKEEPTEVWIDLELVIILGSTRTCLDASIPSPGILTICVCVVESCWRDNTDQLV